MTVPFSLPIPTRWADLDGFGHVHNPVFLTYLEVGRDAWFAGTLGDREVYVVARVEIDFVAPIGRHVAEVVVQIQPEAVGKKSITTRESISDGGGLVFARARTVSVRWDATTGTPQLVTESERDALLGDAER